MVRVTPPRPLAADDDRGGFDCGRASLNHWFLRHAWRNQQTGVSRTNVLTDSDTGRIAGFVSLSSAQIERAWLAKPRQRHQPDPVPVTLLGQLAVDRQYQGEGHARSLLLFALKTALLSSKSIGSFGVLTHPLDDNVRNFYQRWGFQDLPFDPQQAMIVRMKDLEQSGFL
ncbi:MAG TPA: GNAT family N-acetyltransferase [Gammaproteobacteria bacterium]|nr:GNAT family N-acetyltransferase [Gammaproteobacteria bacterium]